MKEKINIPEPCSVQWNEMSPIDSNKRHCLSCQAPVVDFTNKTLEEIQEFFKSPGNEKTCGRYNERHTEFATPFDDKLNRIEEFFSRFRMKKLAFLLITCVLFFASCNKNVRGRRKTGVRTTFSKHSATNQNKQKI